MDMEFALDPMDRANTPAHGIMALRWGFIGENTGPKFKNLTPSIPFPQPDFGVSFTPLHNSHTHIFNPIHSSID
jgi:hypothetical protein